MNTPGGPVYPGVAFHRDFEGGTARGRIRIGAGSVQFESEAGESLVALPLAGLQARTGGATGEHLYLSHPQYPGWTLTTADPAIFKDPRLLAEAGLARQVRRVSWGQKLALIGCLGVILTLVAGVALVFAFRNALEVAVARRIPPALEARLGEAAFSRIEEQKILIDDPELTRQLQQMAEPLLASVSDRRWKYRLHLARASEPNAFALPGGIIVVHSGLILEAKRPEEVLGVLAHEIAHVTRQHGTRQLISRAGLWLLIQAAVGDVQGLMGFLIDSGAYLLTQSYSRDYEREADETGWQYLVEAGLDPSGLLDFFRRIRELEEKTVIGTMPAILSTHPATDDRIAWLESKWEKEEKKRDFKSPPVDFQAFQERLRKATGETGAGGTP